MRTIIVLSLLCAFSATLHAEEVHVIDDVWFDLASAYTGEALCANSLHSDENWKRVEFKLSERALWMKSYRIEKDGTETLFDERYGDRTESVLMYHESSDARSSSRFREELSDAGEITISPISILRLIRDRRDDLGLHIVKRHDSGKVTIGFTLTAHGTTEEHEFDVTDRKITEYRSTKRKNQFVVIVTYGEWVTLEDASPVPTDIVNQIWTGQGDTRTVEYVRLHHVHALSDEESPRRPQIPSGYTYKDRRAGLFEETPVANETQGRRPAPVQKNQSVRKTKFAFILIGSSLCLVSVVLIVIKSRRG